LICDCGWYTADFGHQVTVPGLGYKFVVEEAA